jgi:hypothetical protein
MPRYRDNDIMKQVRVDSWVQDILDEASRKEWREQRQRERERQRAQQKDSDAAPEIASDTADAEQSVSKKGIVSRLFAALRLRSN